MQEVKIYYIRSNIYFFNIKTWKRMLWMVESNGGKVEWYANRPTCSRIWNDQINRVLSFPFFSNLRTPFIGANFKNTLLPTTNSESFCLVSTYFFVYSNIICILILIFQIASFVACTSSGLIKFCSPTSS